MASLSSMRRRFGLIAFPVLVGVLGAWLGMFAWSRTTVSLGPFRVQLSSGFGRGVTDIRLPPLGRLTADTHLSPLRFTVALQDVQVQELADRVTARGIDLLVEEVQSDALNEVAPFALRTLGVALAGALILAVLVFRTNWRSVGIAALASLVAVGGAETAAWRTYRPGKFLSPTFSGSLSLAPELIGPAETALDRIDQVRAELRRVLAGATRVYTSIQTGPLGLGDQIRVLHISDLHLSPLGISFAREVADAFDVEFVVDTGDLTSFGTPAEALVLAGIAGFGRPYLYVRGNHDSPDLEDAMRRIPGAVVLDGTTHDVAGLTVYGRAHPVFTPDKLAALADEEIAARLAIEGERMAAELPSSDPPAIVAVHDDRMALPAAGLVPLVISGHFHQPSATVVNGTLFLRVGSTGGAGANVFTQEGGVPLSAEVLYFDRADLTLVAYDLIEQSPESGSLVVDRHLISEEFGSLTPTPSPASPAPSPTPTGPPTAP
ncbi:MAG: metallophosphoesterase family protein [Actinomycetota bacterium]